MTARSRFACIFCGAQGSCLCCFQRGTWCTTLRVLPDSIVVLEYYGTSCPRRASEWSAESALGGGARTEEGLDGPLDATIKDDIFGRPCTAPDIARSDSQPRQKAGQRERNCARDERTFAPLPRRHNQTSTA